MKVLLAEKAGFCYGVRRSIDIAFKALNNKDSSNVCSLGPLIHNPQMVEKLKEQGLEVVEELEKIDHNTVLIIRSHGVHPETLKRAQKIARKVIDATCPFVKKAQHLTQFLYDEDYLIYIVGEAEHPEVLALQGFACEQAKVVASASEIKAINKKSKIGIIAQTTQNPKNLAEVSKALSTVTKELRVFNTICNATLLRQKSALKLASTVDIMIVLGGKNSANTSRLAVLCKQIKETTHHIETADELKKSWFKGGEIVGITAGASTPDWIIEETVLRLKKWFNN
ncbi:MAG: 4-hydroxy-3-methylbut-2-enyl diphosphate reductase [Candidatus Coatesbacteria bacterium]|nr:4-hydroxy-3-methylbut-2-enyl diphosphate reductase [Candidatus Coatesbacteria bacterium]